MVQPHDAESRVVEIENTLEAMQQVVGGLIEPFEFGFDGEFRCYCNEEGLLLGLPRNGPVVGTFFITKEDNEGRGVSLNSSETLYLLSVLNG